MDKIINLGIIATGHIAEKVTETLIKMSCLKVYAVASRTLDKAKNFAAKFNIPNYYGSYKEMLANPDIDLIYITTPHSEHAKNIELCAKYKKNILSEKAFTLNEKDAEKAIKTCIDNNVLIAEAVWCRYAPMAQTIKEFINSGKLGKIKYITANIGYNVYHRERVHNRALGGGALLDVGVYALNFVDLILNGKEPISINVESELDEYGVDKNEITYLTYPDDVKVCLYSSITSQTDRFGFVYGENGYIIVDNINLYSRLRYFDNSRSDEPIIDIKAPECISGYEYEFEECCKAINEGKTEVQHSEYSQILRIMRTMDRIRKEMNVVYDCDLQ